MNEDALGLCLAANSPYSVGLAFINQARILTLQKLAFITYVVNNGEDIPDLIAVLIFEERQPSISAARPIRGFG